MRCLAAGYEERRWQRQQQRQQKWRNCCGGGVGVPVPVAVDVDVDGACDGIGWGCGGLWPIARPVQVPEPAQDETAGVPTARAQRQRVLDHRQRPVGGTHPAKRLQVYGAGTQLQCRYRVQR